MVNSAGRSGARRSCHCLRAAPRCNRGRAGHAVVRNRKTDRSLGVGVATCVQQRDGSEESGCLSGAGLSVLVWGRGPAVL